MSVYKYELQMIFYGTQTPEIIDADVQKLPELYQQVIERDGGWPPKPFR